MKEVAFSKQNTNAIKGLAILFMIYHHCFATVDRFEKYEVSFAPLSEGLGVAISLSMKICVGMFVFLSAYGMTMSMKKYNENCDLTGKQIVGMTKGRMVSLLGNFMILALLVQFLDLFLGDKRILRVYGKGIMGFFHAIIDLLGLADVLQTPTFLATWWYMSTAIILIFILPLLVILYKKIGGLSIFLVALLPYLFTIRYENMVRYLLVIMLGMVFAMHDLFAKVKKLQVTSPLPIKIIRGLLELTLIWLLLYARIQPKAYNLVELWDSVVPVLVILFAYEFILVIPGIHQLLEFLGKYSMNIFLAHNCFRVFWMADFIYSFRSAWLISLVLLVISLAFSVLMEGFKKLIRYDKFLSRVKSKVA
ncbi:MAG: heparan-alpha-glucosaminide N-acetyltransferase domain-containing protein [Eubacterium sp.]|nr:heparan-alpha-glucosaminide N-acetyltransferase domain-containing protein [Eubacterium sp.]